ncbi:TPA: hypothetical protein OMI80_005020 [Klebsiella pneumoniae]|uniref:hypothetical protein n=1 Tax=Klebsiella pneumoniae TaxID=573 RepID=UPI000E2D410A|nr:hypothetical protein [Klebsiella pneumoniae]HED3305690.1 hypothetical protein [Klebsiella quasipneumoniae subsp. similipneumoniae]SYG07744.1 Uncharacterised protein [Klebsiella pneumoniae]HBW7970650.1 hypothetical protein [Klebsiella pneumoniae]HBY2240901.1 hypothetical protein [Klebsiella pneumoniae]HCQ9070211.1 hypothetical protein [Klebsiella pneumoniae]
MALIEDIFKIIGAASGVEDGRSISSTATDPLVAGKSPSSKPASSGEENQEDVPDSKAEQEEQAFAANTGALHEFMQQNRMDSLQAQLDMLQSQVRDKVADANGKEIDNDLRKRMASFTFQFMVWWCIFVATMFTSYLIANNGSPPPETMIALLGTSTISIVGLVGFVVSGLFKSRKDSDKEKDK